VVFDGEVWAERIDLAATLDAAAAHGELPPLRAALVGNGSPDRRWAELGVPAGTVEHVRNELLPTLRARWAIPHGKVVATGASFGGIAALWLAALAQGDVGAVVAQSP